MTKERQQKNKAPWTTAAQPTNISCTVIYFIIIFIIIIIMQKLQITLQTTMQFNSEHNCLLCKNTHIYTPNPQPNPQTFLSVMPVLKLPISSCTVIYCSYIKGQQKTQLIDLFFNKSILSSRYLIN